LLHRFGAKEPPLVARPIFEPRRTDSDARRLQGVQPPRLRKGEAEVRVHARQIAREPAAAERHVDLVLHDAARVQNHARVAALQNGERHRIRLLDDARQIRNGANHPDEVQSVVDTAARGRDVQIVWPLGRERRQLSMQGTDGRLVNVTHEMDVVGFIEHNR
jgi:hypothetical protein